MHLAALDVASPALGARNGAPPRSPLDGSASSFRWARPPTRGPAAAPPPSSGCHEWPPKLRLALIEKGRGKSKTEKKKGARVAVMVDEGAPPAVFLSANGGAVAVPTEKSSGED
jgi:hypothetical protein